jgi:hypothetical protein
VADRALQLLANEPAAKLTAGIADEGHAMDRAEHQVASASELAAAAGNPRVGCITVQAALAGMRSLRLSPGQSLCASGPGIALRFAPGEHGVEISTDNRIEDLDIYTDPERCAVFNDASVDSLGRFVLRNLRVHGVVRLLACDKVRAGHVEVENIDVVAADARGYETRPRGYGVEVITGAFTLWNQQKDPAVTITADLTGVSAGRAGAPVRGSGIFVAGAGEGRNKCVVSGVG